MTDPNPVESSKKPFYGWKNAGLLAFIYMAATGLVTYGFSVIFPVMIRTMGWSRGDASVASSIARFVSGFLGPVQAFFINTYGSRKTIATGLLMLLVSLALLATVTTKLWHWMAIYGVLIPASRKFCGGIATQVVVINWFNVKRAMVLGLVLTSAAVSGTIAQPIYTHAMQITGTWQTGWIISGSFISIALILSFWIRNKPSELGQYPDGIEPVEKSQGGGRDQNSSGTFKTQDNWTVGEVFRTRILWIYFFVGMLQGLPFNLILQHGVLHLTDVGYTSMQAAVFMSVITFFSGMARFPMGWIGDRVEPKRLVFIALSCMMLGFLGFWKAPSFNLLIASGPFIGFCTGTMVVMMPTLLSNYFGPAPFASIRGYMAPPRTIVTAGFPPLAGYVADKYGSYDLICAPLIICLIISMIGTLFLSPPKKSDKKRKV